MFMLLTSRVSGSFQVFYQTSLHSQFTPLRIRKEPNYNTVPEMTEDCLIIFFQSVLEKAVTVGLI